MARAMRTRTNGCAARWEIQSVVRIRTNEARSPKSGPLESWME